jgi:hypothetical protein
MMNSLVSTLLFPSSIDATLHLSGKVEETKNMIKSLRRAFYGYPEEEYFFLKIFDASKRCSPGRESVAAKVLPTGFEIEPFFSLSLSFAAFPLECVNVMGILMFCNNVKHL